MITKTRKIYLIIQVNAQASIFVKIFRVSVINSSKKNSGFFTPVGLKARKMQKATLSVERANCASAGGLEGASRKEWDALLYASLSPLTWELHFEKLMKLNLGVKKEKLGSAVETRQADAVAGENIDEAN